jgi:hypothetical protein
LIQNPTLKVHDIAGEEQVSAAYLYTLLRLPWLAPDITTAIINGRSPPQLTAQQLKRLTPRLPASWPEHSSAALESKHHVVFCFRYVAWRAV